MPLRNSHKIKICREAFLEVKSVVHDNYGADNIGDPERPIIDEDGDKMPISGLVSFMRSEAKKNAGRQPTRLQRIKAYDNAAREFKCGRCMGQSSMAAIYLASKGVACSFVTVDMNQNNDQHVFVIADIDKPRVGVSLAALGSIPVCDPWLSLKAITETTLGLGAGATTCLNHSGSLLSLGYSNVIKTIEFIAAE